MLEKEIADARHRMEQAVDHTRHALVQVRTGRASPALLDGVKVLYYGAPVPLKSIANVSAPEARMLMITPFDKSAIKDIEKAILASDLGLNPSTDGSVVRLPIPPLTEERRKELVRLLHHQVEEGRIAVRNIRKDLHNEIREKERVHMISQDDAKRLNDSLQKMTDKFIADLDQAQAAKEREVLHD